MPRHTKKTESDLLQKVYNRIADVEITLSGLTMSLRDVKRALSSFKKKKR